MSTILEALKKSEAQRQSQQGSASGADMSPRREGSNRLLFSMLLVAAVLLGVGIFRAGWLDGITEAPVADIETEQPSTLENAVALKSGEDRVPAPVQDSDAAELPVGPRAATDTPGPAPTSSIAAASRPEAQNNRETQSDPNGADTVADRRALLRQQRAAALDRGTEGDADQPETEQLPAALPDPVNDKVVQVDLGPTTPSQPGPARQAKPATAERVPGNERETLPLIETLGADARRMELVQRVVNMQVYSENPDKRFVLIDLRRHVEGDAITEDVVLEKILADAMIVSLDDQRYIWAPRP